MEMMMRKKKNEKKKKKKKKKGKVEGLVAATASNHIGRITPPTNGQVNIDYKNDDEWLATENLEGEDAEEWRKGDLDILKVEEHKTFWHSMENEQPGKRSSDSDEHDDKDFDKAIARLIRLGFKGLSKRPSTQRPITTTRRPSATTRRPSATTRIPLATTRRPSATTRRPSATTRRPPATTRRPPATTRRPPATTRRPSATTRRPSATTRRPSATTRRPLVTTRRSRTTVAHQTTNTRHGTTSSQLTSTSRQTTKHRQITTIGRPLTTTQRPRTTTNHQMTKYRETIYQILSYLVRVHGFKGLSVQTTATKALTRSSTTPPRPHPKQTTPKTTTILLSGTTASITSYKPTSIISSVVGTHKLPLPGTTTYSTAISTPLPATTKTTTNHKTISGKPASLGYSIWTSLRPLPTASRIYSIWTSVRPLPTQPSTAASTTRSTNILPTQQPTVASTTSTIATHTLPTQQPTASTIRARSTSPSPTIKIVSTTALPARKY
ncbi:hypothetical protein ElyMa_003603200 [Elysia marginata]|uniref:Uncharacterized protein n=1 Tax=Elysia marginata TaxID=1093978 RepID=A0AAV4ERQ8_9GAST|nr:hypothetical protein ElyMa_003603200 [Elysia marginata]